MIKPASVVVQWGRQRNTALPDQLSKVDFRHGMLELFADNQGWYQPPGTNRSGPASPSSPPTSPLRARRITSAEETVSMITGAEIDDVFNKCECVRCCRPLGLHHIPCADTPRCVGGLKFSFYFKYRNGRRARVCLSVEAFLKV